jgi:PKD domain
MKKIQFLKYIAVVVMTAAFMACEPQVDDKIDIGGVPTAAFDVTPTSNPNKFTLTNKSTGTFLYKWDLGDGSSADSTVVLATYPRKGTYKVVLNAFGKGGYATATKDIVVTQDDPTACTGNMQLLTGCGTKTWKLAPIAGALWVGPDASFGTTWWSNPAGDVATRVCQFNDEYIFSSNGTFKYDGKGDFWADSDNNGNVFPAGLGLSVGCQPISAMPAAYKAWGASDLRTFTISNTELKVVGSGAYIGLYKVGNGAEVMLPQQTVTYTIKELTATRMVVYINFGPGIWRFTLVSA